MSRRHGRSHVLAALALLILPIGGDRVHARTMDAQSQPPATVANVDLERYAGRWYEISRFPNRFQDHCTGDVTATYSLLENNRVSVVNECRTKSGSTDRAEGVARVVSKDGSNSKLKVRFAPAFLTWLPIVWGDYWVLDLADDYSYVLVGSPNRDYLWVLARTPVLDDASYDRLVEAASARGFDAKRLVKTKQSASSGRAADRQCIPRDGRS